VQELQRMPEFASPFRKFSFNWNLDSDMLAETAIFQA
jgi:hypothetical protein